MNPKEIKENCPKAMDAYAEWIFGENYEGYVYRYTDEHIIVGDDIHTEFEWRMGREVYDFFDEANIFVSVYYDPYMVIEHELPFMYDVNGDKPGLGYKTRRDAEKTAFEKAFAEYETKMQS